MCTADLKSAVSPYLSQVHTIQLTWTTNHLTAFAIIPTPFQQYTGSTPSQVGGVWGVFFFSSHSPIPNLCSGIYTKGRFQVTYQDTCMIFFLNQKNRNKTLEATTALPTATSM